MKDCNKCVGCNTGNEVGAGAVRMEMLVFTMKYKKGEPEPDCPRYLLKYEYLSERGKAIIDAARKRAAEIVDKPPYCAWMQKGQTKKCDVCRRGCAARPIAVRATPLNNGGFALPTIDQKLKKIGINQV